MARHKIMDQTGHSLVEFDPAKTTDLKEAMERFDGLTKRGYRAAKANGDGTHELVKSFNPADEDVVFFPQLVGG